jgi:hypothetical protein
MESCRSTTSALEEDVRRGDVALLLSTYANQFPSLSSPEFACSSDLCDAKRRHSRSPLDPRDRHERPLTASEEIGWLEGADTASARADELWHGRRATITKTEETHRMGSRAPGRAALRQYVSHAGIIG